jgi:hypothetical protein
MDLARQLLPSDDSGGDVDVLLLPRPCKSILGLRIRAILYLAYQVSLQGRFTASAEQSAAAALSAVSQCLSLNFRHEDSEPRLKGEDEKHVFVSVAQLDAATSQKASVGRRLFSPEKEVRQGA